MSWKLGKLPKDTLEFVDPVRIEKVNLAGVSIAGRRFRCALSQMRLLGDETGIARGISYAREYANLAGIYFLEPYQPGKIPLVLIHGTQTEC